MDPEVEVALLRTAQEALAMHAGASRVTLTRSYLADLVTLDIRDGSCGMFTGDPGFEVVGEATDGEEAVTRAAARRLSISEASVKTHLLHVYAKLGVNDRAAVVAAAYERAC